MAACAAVVLPGIPDAARQRRLRLQSGGGSGAFESIETGAHLLPQGHRSQLQEGPRQFRSKTSDRAHRPTLGTRRLSASAAMSEQRKKLRLGELLIQQGLITPDQLR